MESALRLPVLSCAEAAAIETAFISGDKALSWRLMRCASLGIAHQALALLRRRPRRILVLAGKGNNGADAFLAALHCARRDTEILAVFAEARPAGAQAIRAWATRKPGVKVRLLEASALPELSAREFCLIFDGILGQGFRGTLTAGLRRFLRATGKLRGLRVAVDLPSGLGDDSRGPAFRADLTVSIGCLKRPLLRPSARRFVGRIRVIDIGLPLAETEEACCTGEILRLMPARRRADSDKRHQGRLLIVGGSENMPGAVLMNTRAALQSGAALVTTALPTSLRARAAVAHPEAMWRGLRTDRRGLLSAKELPALRKILREQDAWLIGSGMGAGAESFIRKLVQTGHAGLVIDADALRPSVVRASARTAVRILLPHAGEFKRLTGRTMTPEAGRTYARKTGSILVLKGPLTCVTDGVRILHIPFGGPVLARGGSGDLLAGIVVSVLARRDELKLTPLEAVQLAVVWHACAADLLGEKRGEEAVRTTELLAELSPALRT